MAYRLPTEEERRMLFAWLVQASSLRAWQRVFALHKVFLDTVEQAHEESETRRPPGTSAWIPSSFLADIFTSHHAFRVALERLRRGDRRCFLYVLGAPGYFREGIRQADWWADMEYGAHSGRNGFAPLDSPSWHRIDAALTDVVKAYAEIDAVLQPQFSDVPAPVYSIDSCKGLATYVQPFESSELQVPEIEPPIFVKTGEKIPCFGIWEPANVKYSGGLFGLLRDPIRPPDGVFPIEGCMNYLQEGARAPTIGFEGDSPARNGRGTTWRLIWKDERYGEHGVPEEERRYVFNEPAARITS